MQKSKITTIGIILVTIVLAGVAIFTAVRLYQTRATKVTPTDSKAAAVPAFACTSPRIPNPVASYPECTITANNTPCCINPTSSTPPPTCEHAVPPAGCRWTGPDIFPACAATLVCATPTSTTCAQVAGSCLNNSNQCVTYTDSCQRANLCKAPLTTCTSTTPTTPPTGYYFYNTQTSACELTTGHSSLASCVSNLSLTWPTKFGGACYATLNECSGSVTNSCSPKYYFNTVLTDANGDNAGTCVPSNKTFNSSLISCDGTNQTCDQFLAALSVSTGVTKVQGGCFNNLASCVSPNGQTVGFRFFYDTVQKKCISTNHRYNSQDVDVDDVNHMTCLQSLNLYQPNARKVCYTSKPLCQSSNTLPTPTATATVRPTATPMDLPNTCLLEFTLATGATPTPTATSASVTLSATPNCTSINYSWSSVSNAAGYYLDISKTSSFTEFVSSGRLQGNVTSYTFSNLDSNTNYYARISVADLPNFPQYSTKGPTKTTVCSTATATSVATVTPTATATAVPQCNNSCTTNSNCPSGLICYITSGSTSGSCRNTQCLSETDCSCNANVPTNTATATSGSNTAINPTTAATNQPQLPDAGTSWPTMLGTGFGILVILGSLLLAL